MKILPSSTRRTSALTRSSPQPGGWAEALILTASTMRLVPLPSRYTNIRSPGSPYKDGKVTSSGRSPQPAPAMD